MTSDDTPRIARFKENPIITPALRGVDGYANINGPSLIRVPPWVPRPLSRYYLYFADHHGQVIYLAYADDLHGPWRLHAPGVLRLEQAAGCRAHVASPDVLVDEDGRIRMYFHGPVRDAPGQKTFLALSADGLAFEAGSTPLAGAYLRLWRWEGAWYGLGRGGVLYRSPDGLAPFETGPVLLPGGGADVKVGPRHVAVDLRGEELWVYWSQAGDTPEHILRGRVRLSGDWAGWTVRDVRSVLLPETDYEGANLPLKTSATGAARGPERALRDPGIFREGGRTYLLYSVAGESGIAIAEIAEPGGPPGAA